MIASRQDSSSRNLRLSWIITTKCNLTCKHCYVDSSPYKGEEVDGKIVSHILNSIVSSLPEYNIESVTLSGGEPLLNRNIKNIVDATREHSKYVGIATNFIKYKKLLEVWGNVDSVSVGLEGASLTPIIRGIQWNYYLTAFKHIYNEAKDLNKISLDITLFRSTSYKDIKSVVNLSRKFDIPVILFRRFIPIGRGKYLKNEILNIEIYTEKIKLLLQEAAKYGIMILSEDPMYSIILRVMNSRSLSKIEELIPKRFQSGCRALAGLSLGIYLKCFVPCPLLWEYFMNLKHDMTPRQALMYFSDKSKLNKSCYFCPLQFVCGGCRAYAYAIGKDPWGVDVLCPLTH